MADLVQLAQLIEDRNRVARDISSTIARPAQIGHGTQCRTACPEPLRILSWSPASPTLCAEPCRPRGGRGGTMTRTEAGQHGSRPSLRG